MFNTEKDLNQFLQTKLASQARLLHWQRVESSIGSGTPDVNFCIDSHDWWIELKVISLNTITRETQIKVKWRPGQVAWLVNRIKAGGNAGVMIGVTITRVNMSSLIFVRSIEGILSLRGFISIKDLMSMDGAYIMDIELPRFSNLLYNRLIKENEYDQFNKFVETSGRDKIAGVQGQSGELDDRDRYVNHRPSHHQRTRQRKKDKNIKSSSGISVTKGNR